MGNPEGFPKPLRGLLADRGLEGSWLCSWAVLIAEVDEKRRIQHAPSAFGREEG
jgi:hypothetical protein